MPWILGHLLLSAAAAVGFAWQFGQNPRVVASHMLLVGEWDLALFALLSVVAAWASPRARWPGLAFRLLLALTCTLQVYLYALNLVSNLSWGRNMTGRIVVAFAPTVWSGREPFPVGPVGITTFACATLVLMTLALTLFGRSVEPSLWPRPTESYAAAQAGLAYSRPAGCRRRLFDDALRRHDHAGR